MSSAAIQAPPTICVFGGASRQFADALTVHGPGLAVTGADAFGGHYTSGAMFVQDAVGLPWVALTSGTTGSIR